MQANTLTPFELFGNQVRYVVPMFQRPYVWNRDKQWVPLWEDVRTIADRILEANSLSSPHFKVEPVPAHFLGAIVLDQQLVPPPYISLRHIIDGQQRLTTLQLILDAVEEIVREYGSSVDASALQSLILNNAQIAASPDDVYKVWPTNYDRAAFRAVMDDETKVDGELSKSLLSEAHDYFRSEAEEWAEVNGDPDKTVLRLNALTRALSQHLRLVVIDLEPSDNAQVIFETLNHRGTPLLASDLVKNFVFQVAAADGADVDSIYEEYWEPFDAKSWRDKVGRGRQRRPRIDVFLNYWLVMKMTREVPADHIYSDFRTFVLSQDLPITTTVAELAEGANVFDQLESQPWTSVEGTFAYRVLTVLEQTAWGPWLLWLYSFDESLIPLEQRHKALRAVESWAVRRMLVRASTKGTTRLVIDLLEAVSASDPALVGDVTEQFLLRETSDTNYWPADDDVIDACATLPLYRAITRARLRMTLEALEDSMRSPKTEEEHCVRGRLTIEHIMPQGWVEHWPLPSDGHPELMAVERERLIHVLGNLTLVNNKLNPALSNRPWTDQEAKDRGVGEVGKRSILNENSVLFLNKEIVDLHPHSWSEADINVRGLKLARRITSIWQRPNTERPIEQIDPAETLGVEVEQYAGPEGSVLVPSVVGVTSEPETEKAPDPAPKWDRESFIRHVAEQRSPEEAAVATRVLDWAGDRSLDVWWGNGRKTGSFSPKLYVGADRYNMFTVYSDGSVPIQFGSMQVAPFDSIGKRRELADQIEGTSDKIVIADEGLEQWPALKLHMLTDGNALDGFLAAWDWFIDQVREWTES